MNNPVDMRKMTGGNSGAITVEASIIIPVAILGMVSVIYMALLLYQGAMVRAAAEMAATAGAKAWASGINELRAGKPSPADFEEYGLYRRLHDAGKEERLKLIEEFALSAASRNEIIKPVFIDAKAAIRDFAAYRRLEVRIESAYNLPLGNFLGIFGGSGSYRVNAKAVSPLDEPVELIRTTDFIVDIEKKLAEKFPEIKNLEEKSRNAIIELKSRIEKMFN